MACSGAYASAAEYDEMMCSDMDLSDPDVVAKINLYLTIAASDVHSALASVGACSCTLASWATAYLKKLNIIDAAVLQNCPCGNKLSQEARQMWLEWLNNQYTLIREGKIELCSGYTGSEYPAIGSVEQSLTEWTTAEIIINANQRTP
jgi:hypothetical protein